MCRGLVDYRKDQEGGPPFDLNTERTVTQQHEADGWMDGWMELTL